MRIRVAFLLIFIFSNQVFAGPEEPVLARLETYDQLVQAIRQVRVSTRRRIEQDINREKVREAWEIGKLIETHVLQHKERADYGRRVIRRLAGDLGIGVRELYYMLEFYRVYPIMPPGAQLSWSHYKALLDLKDGQERERLMSEAVKKGWNRDQLRAEVRRRQAFREPSPENAPESVLTARPGRVGVYRIIRAKAGPFQGELAVDLGFANYLSLGIFPTRRWPKEIRNFKENDLVISNGGKLKPFKGSSEDRYTYRAYIIQVIDGDTFKAVVDLGFSIATVQILRLRGLDAPEIESGEGREAKAFLEMRLAKSTPVLIKTAKSDKYDRYLADVFVDGHYVNQELLDRELAEKVSS